MRLYLLYFFSSFLFMSKVPMQCCHYLYLFGDTKILKNIRQIDVGI